MALATDEDIPDISDKQAMKMLAEDILNIISEIERWNLGKDASDEVFYNQLDRLYNVADTLREYGHGVQEKPKS